MVEFAKPTTPKSVVSKRRPGDFSAAPNLEEWARRLHTHPSIQDMDDVDIRTTPPSTGDVLKYGANGIWTPAVSSAPGAHALDSDPATHTATGLSVGQVIRATGTTSFDFAVLQHGDLGGVGVNDHHAQVHTHVEADITNLDHPVDTVFGRLGAVVAASNDYTWAQIDKTVSALADITTRPHSALTGIGADDHHTESHTHVEANITNLAHKTNLGSLDDVTITAITSGEIPKWSGSAWINNTLAEAGIAATGHGHVEADISNLNHPIASVFGRTGVVVAATNDYTWAQIDKTVSDLADLTTADHAVLTGIGDYDHSAIDIHIASTSNPHSVDSSDLADLVKTDGSRPLTANWNVGAYKLTTQAQDGFEGSHASGLFITSAQQLDLRSTGAQPVRVNPNPNMGTGGFEVWDGAATPAKVFGVDSAGNVIMNGTVDGVDIATDILLRDGSVPLTADWDVGAFNITAATYQADGATGAAYVASNFDAVGRWFAQTKLASDAESRLIIRADGLHEWGDGTASEDTNLYRSAANTLKTDDNFVVGTQVKLFIGGDIEGIKYVNSAAPATYDFYKARGTQGTPLRVEKNDYVSRININGYSEDAASFIQAASIIGYVDDPFITGATPLSLRFYAWPTGTTPAVETLRIESNKDIRIFGNLLVGAADTNLYRGAANQLKTDDALYVVGNILTDGTVDGVDVSLKDAVSLQGYNVQNVAPTGGYVLKWSSGNSRWEPTAEGGGTSHDLVSATHDTGGMPVDGHMLTYDGANWQSLAYLPVPYGTAALPTYTFDDDLNTGIYHPASDQVGIATGGAVRGIFASTGLTLYQDLYVDGQDIYLGSADDVRLSRSAADVLKLYDSLNLTTTPPTANQNWAIQITRDNQRGIDGVDRGAIYSVIQDTQQASPITHNPPLDGYWSTLTQQGTGRGHNTVSWHQGDMWHRNSIIVVNEGTPDLVGGDIGKTVRNTTDGVDLGPLVAYDNPSQTWEVFNGGDQPGDGRSLQITGGTAGTWTVNGGSSSSTVNEIQNYNGYVKNFIMSGGKWSPETQAEADDNIDSSGSNSIWGAHLNLEVRNNKADIRGLTIEVKNYMPVKDVAYGININTGDFLGTAANPIKHMIQFGTGHLDANGTIVANYGLDLAGDPILQKWCKYNNAAIRVPNGQGVQMGHSKSTFIIGNASGEITFKVDNVADAFVIHKDRVHLKPGTSNPTPVAGAMYYNSSSQEIRVCVNGTDWRAISLA